MTAGVWLQGFLVRSRAKAPREEWGCIHPRKLTWKSKITIFERRYILKTTIFGICGNFSGGYIPKQRLQYFNLWGCMAIFVRKKWSRPSRKYPLAKPLAHLRWKLVRQSSSTHPNLWCQILVVAARTTDKGGLNPDPNFVKPVFARTNFVARVEPVLTLRNILQRRLSKLRKFESKRRGGQAPKSLG